MGAVRVLQTEMIHWRIVLTSLSFIAIKELQDRLWIYYEILLGSVIVQKTLSAVINLDLFGLLFIL